MKKGKFKFYTTKKEVKAIENLINSNHPENIQLAVNLIRTNRAYKHWKYMRKIPGFYSVTLENILFWGYYRQVLLWLYAHSR